MMGLGASHVAPHMETTIKFRVVDFDFCAACGHYLGAGPAIGYFGQHCVWFNMKSCSRRWRILGFLSYHLRGALDLGSLDELLEVCFTSRDNLDVTICRELIIASYRFIGPDCNIYGTFPVLWSCFRAVFYQSRARN
jgi:hypothetical protein